MSWTDYRVQLFVQNLRPEDLEGTQCAEFVFDIWNLLRRDPTYEGNNGVGLEMVQAYLIPYMPATQELSLCQPMTPEQETEAREKYGAPKYFPEGTTWEDVDRMREGG